MEGQILFGIVEEAQIDGAENDAVADDGGDILKEPRMAHAEKGMPEP